MEVLGSIYVGSVCEGVSSSHSAVLVLLEVSWGVSYIFFQLSCLVGFAQAIGSSAVFLRGIGCYSGYYWCRLRGLV